MLDEEISIKIKYSSPEDANYWKNRTGLALRQKLTSRHDFRTTDTLFQEKIAVNYVDPATIEFKVPARSIINIGLDYNKDVFDEIAFRGNHYNKKLYYDGKLIMYNNRLFEREKVRLRLRGFKIKKYFFDID